MIEYQFKLKYYSFIPVLILSISIGILSSLILYKKIMLIVVTISAILIILNFVLYKLIQYKYNLIFSLFFIIGFFFLTIRGLIITNFKISKTFEPIISVVWQELFLFIMLLIIFNKYKEIKFNLFEIFLLFYLLNGLIFSIFDLTSGIYAIRITFYPVIFYFFTRLLIYNTQIYKMHNLLLMLMLLCSVLGIILYFGISEDHFFELVYKYNFITQEKGYLYYENVLRMTSILWNPLSFAALMTMASSFFYCMYSILKRKFYFFCFICTSVCIIFSMVRAAWIGWIISQIIITIILRKSLKWLFAFGISTIIIYLVLVKMEYIGNIINHLLAILPWGSDTYEVNDAYSLRLNQWIYGIKEFTSHPFGTGTGTVGGATQLRLEQQDINYTRVISDGYYFKLLVENGIQGFIFFILFLMVFLKKCFNMLVTTKIKDKNFIIVLGTFASLIAFSLQGIVANNWDFVLLPYIYFFYLAITTTILTQKIKVKN